MLKSLKNSPAMRKLSAIHLQFRLQQNLKQIVKRQL